MSARQVLNVAYASITEGAGEEGRAHVDDVLNGRVEPETDAKANAEALDMLGARGFRVGMVR